MASSNNTRLLAIGGVVLFVGGCLAGMRTHDTGDRYCVVTEATAASHPGYSAGQFVEEPPNGCIDGEHEVCGHFVGSGTSRKFDSASCP